MTARPIFPESRRKLVHIAGALCIVMVAVLLAAGCTTTPTLGNLTSTPTQTRVSPTKEKSVSFYMVTIPQPEGIHPDYIKMDSDVYIQGEIINFYIINEGSEALMCWIPSSVHLYRQIGAWELQMEPEKTQINRGYYLKPGESTSLQRLSTTDRTPGHYKMVTDCGVSREFEIRVAPTVT
ncbi:MAG: hypothetical protein WAK10_05565 [Methanoregula sp.]